MQELKDRIVKEGKILPGNIVKVDGFLNHRVDCAFMGRIADEFQKFFDLDKVDLILTAEASGIALSAICAYRYGKPMVYAKRPRATTSRAACIRVRSFPIPTRRRSRCSSPRNGCTRATVCS